MKKILYGAAALGLFIGFTSVVVSCGSSNSPSSPAATPTSVPSTPTATATIGVPSAFVTFGMAGSPAYLSYGTTNILWVCNYQSNLQGWTTVGVGPSPNISTYNGSTNFGNAKCNTVDRSSGNVYQTDGSNHQVAVFNSSGTYLNIFGSTQIGSDTIQGVAVNSSGTTACVSDSTSNNVLVYSIGGSASSPTYSYVTTVLGGGTLSFPNRVYYDQNNNFWVSDSNHSRVLEYDPTLTTQQKAVTLTSGSYAADIIVDNQGNLFAADNNNGYIQIFNSSGQHLYNLGPGGIGTSFTNLYGVTLDTTNTYLYCIDGTVFKVYGFKIH
jgi:hypothetical protein